MANIHKHKAQLIKLANEAKQVITSIIQFLLPKILITLWFCCLIIYAQADGLFAHLTEVVCGDPGSGSNVTKEGTKYVYGGIVTYTCVPQHVLTGGGLEKQWIRCTSQGTWNGSAPSCERK